MYAYDATTFKYANIIKEDMLKSRKILIYQSFFIPVVLIVFLATAISFNPWFSFTKNALSDLGSSKAQYPFIFNSMLMLIAAMGVMFSASFYSWAKTDCEKISACIVCGAMISLAFVGIFPEETAFHFPAAFSFYILSGVGALVYAPGAWRKNKPLAIFAFTVLPATILAFLLSPFRGIAIPELIGASFIIGWLLALAVFILNTDRRF